MSRDTTIISDEEDGRTIFPAPLDDETVARLILVAEEAGVPPAEVIASIVREVLLDDELEHGGSFPTNGLH